MFGSLYIKRISRQKAFLLTPSASNAAPNPYSPPFIASKRVVAYVRFGSGCCPQNLPGNTVDCRIGWGPQLITQNFSHIGSHNLKKIHSNVRSLQNSSPKGVLFFLEERLLHSTRKKKINTTSFQAQKNGYLNYYSLSTYVPVTILKHIEVVFNNPVAWNFSPETFLKYCQKSTT